MDESIKAMSTLTSRLNLGSLRQISTVSIEILHLRLSLDCCLKLGDIKNN